MEATDASAGPTALALVLQGKYDAEGNLESHGTARRIVTVDLSDEDHWGDIGLFVTPDGVMHRGLGNDEDGYWLITDAFELIEPEVELHEGKYPVGYFLTDNDLSEVLEETRP